ncbi:MAG: sporulation protein YabP [Clostridia bacterium]|nr:sporulation protein YabP [Clostridia bacterium]
MAEVKHSLQLKNREKLMLDGVREVLRFDEGLVVLETALGALSVEGEGLHVTKLLLDCGEVAIEGHISALLYGDGGEKKRGFFRRLGG